MKFILPQVNNFSTKVLFIINRSGPLQVTNISNYIKYCKVNNLYKAHLVLKVLFAYLKGRGGLNPPLNFFFFVLNREKGYDFFRFLILQFHF